MLICLCTFLFVAFTGLFIFSLGAYGEFTALSYVALVGIVCSFLSFGAVGFMGVRQQRTAGLRAANQLIQPPLI